MHTNYKRIAITLNSSNHPHLVSVTLLSLLLPLRLFLLELFHLIHPKVFHGFQQKLNIGWDVESGSARLNASPVYARVTLGCIMCQGPRRGLNRPGLSVGPELAALTDTASSSARRVNSGCRSPPYQIMKLKAIVKAAKAAYGGINATTSVIGSSLNYLTCLALFAFLSLSPLLN